MYSAMRLLAGAHAVEPIRHVSKRQIVNAHGRKFRFAREKNIFRGPLFIDVGIILVRPYFLNHLIPRAALSSYVDKRRLLPHIARESLTIVAKTC